MFWGGGEEEGNWGGDEGCRKMFGTGRQYATIAWVWTINLRAKFFFFLRVSLDSRSKGAKRK